MSSCPLLTRKNMIQALKFLESQKKMNQLKYFIAEQKIKPEKFLLMEVVYSA